MYFAAGTCSGGNLSFLKIGSERAMGPNEGLKLG